MEREGVERSRGAFDRRFFVYFIEHTLTVNPAVLSALELLGKTLDRDWLRRLKSSGMSEQVYLAFRRGGAGDGDRVSPLDLSFGPRTDQYLY